MLTFRTGQQTDYNSYKAGITAANNVADQLIVSGGNSREISILVSVPAGETIKVVKATCLGIKIVSIVQGGSGAEVTTASAHGLTTGDLVTIHHSDCYPVIDCFNTAITKISNTVFRFTVAQNITKPGYTGIVFTPQNVFRSLESGDLTASSELISDHSGGPFKIIVTSKSGAGSMNLHYKVL